jgi:hypothetical protein
VANNVLTYGTGALNIDATRVSGEKGDGNWRGVTNISAKDQIYAGGWDGSVQGQEPTTADGFVGRWPANTMITHSLGCKQVGVAEDSVVAGERTANFGTQETIAGGNGTGGAMQHTVSVPVWECVEGCPALNFPNSKGGTWNTTAGARHFNNDGEPTLYKTSKSDASEGSAARFFTQTAYSEIDFPDFFYQAKAGKKERNAGLDDLPERAAKFGNQKNGEDLGNGSVNDKFTTQPAQNFHPTVKPLALMRHLVRLVCPPNGVVLDPFLGSGTTAVAAILEGFEWVGCELTEDYWPIIEARVAWAEKERTAQTPEATQPTLFGEQL